MVTIDGVEYTVKSLSLPQVRACKRADVDEADVLAIAWATGVDVDKARVWFNATPAGVASAALAEIFDVSGLSEGAQKSS